MDAKQCVSQIKSKFYLFLLLFDFFTLGASCVFPNKGLNENYIEICLNKNEFELIAGCNLGGYFSCQNGGTCLPNGFCQCQNGFNGLTCLNSEF